MARLLAVLLWWASVAHAAGDGNARAIASFEQGKRLFKLQRYEEGLHAFEEAYLAQPDPQYLLRAADCHRLLGHWDKAARGYRTFLADATDDPDRAEVEQALHEVEARARAVAAPAAPPTTTTTPPPPPRPQARISRIDLRGSLASEDKQRRCNQVIYDHGLAVGRNPPVQAVLVLERDVNELIIYSDGRQVAHRRFEQDPIDRMCAEAVDGIAEALLNDRPARRIEPPRTEDAAPKAAAPDERSLLGALFRQRKLLDRCRATYDPEARELPLAVTVAPSGSVESVELVGADNSTRFANCVTRIVRQASFAPFRGAQVVLRPTLPFSGP